MENPWTVPISYKCTSLDSENRLICMLAQIALINKSRNGRSSKREGEKTGGHSQQHCTHYFTLSPYFERKETGIPISSLDAKAYFSTFKVDFVTNSKGALYPLPMSLWEKNMGKVVREKR